jgi:hypothetical protein
MIRTLVAKTNDGTVANPSDITANTGFGRPITMVAALFTISAATDGSDYAQNTNGPIASTKICQACHSKTQHFQNYSATTTTDPSLHNFASKCTTCHTHTDVTGSKNTAFPGAGDCIGCHTGTAGSNAMKRAPVVGQFASQSHHIQGRALVKTDCYTCHMEADSTGNINSTYHGGSAASGSSVDLVLHVTGARGTSFVRYTANGAAARKRTEYAKVNSQCLSCHTVANATYQPFGDGKTPQTYAWDAKSIAERYTQTGTTPWGKFSFSGGTTPIGGTNAKSGTIKAFSAHGNAANNDMNGANTADTAVTDITSNVNVLCYDCHNSHGSAASGVTSQYSSATGKGRGGILKDVTANTGGYTAAYRPTGATKGKSTFSPGASLCFDCHNTKTNGTATLVSGTAPWGYNSTFGATQALNGYFDTPYFGDYTVPSAKRTTYKLGGTVGSANDRRKPMGGHFGASSAIGVTTTPQQPHASQGKLMDNISGLCTPCHDPHGVSPNTTYVANQTYAVPLLKGTWMTSPYKEDKADISVMRGGGSNYAGITGAAAAIPGYHIDQNTLLAQPNSVGGGASLTSAKSNRRAQTFRNFSNAANKLQTVPVATFAGLCIQCHTQANLTDTAAPSSANWKTKNRIHQSVKGWAATTGTNTGNTIHAYTCSKCHAPHTSRLPRLMVTNCLNINHKGQVASGGTVNTTAGSTTANTGNILQTSIRPTSGRGAGRFPSGGARYTGTATEARNPGPWWFQQTAGTMGTATYATNCHNATNAGGTTFNPTNQQWNTKTPW